MKKYVEKRTIYTIFLYFILVCAAVIFPYSEFTNKMIAIYLSGDYDAFSLIGDTIKYVSTNGIEWGRQLLGALLFFVPRSIWKSKPYGSGQTVFEWMGASFTRLI